MKLDLSVAEAKSMVFKAFMTQTGVPLQSIKFREYPESVDKLNDEVTAAMLETKETMYIETLDLFFARKWLEKHWIEIFEDLKQEARDFVPCEQEPDFDVSRVLNDIGSGKRGSKVGKGYEGFFDKLPRSGYLHTDHHDTHYDNSMFDMYRARMSTTGRHTGDSISATLNTISSTSPKPAV